MREADPFGPIEHDDVLMRPGQSVVQRIAEPQRREVLVERLPRSGCELQIDLVVHADHCALVRVRLCAELYPALIVAKVDALVLRVVDVGGPEEPDVTVLEHVLERLAAERDINVMRPYQLKSRPTLKMKSRGFLLVELGFAFRDFRQGHRKVARLKENLDVASQILVAVEDVLKVKSRDGEKRLWIGPMGQAVDAVISR